MRPPTARSCRQAGGSPDLVGREGRERLPHRTFADADTHHVGCEAEATKELARFVEGREGDGEGGEGE